MDFLSPKGWYVHFINSKVYESVIHPWLASVTMLFMRQLIVILSCRERKQGDIPSILLQGSLLVFQSWLNPLPSSPLYFFLVHN